MKFIPAQLPPLPSHVTSPLSRSQAAAATDPTSQTPNEAARCATEPVESSPPYVSPPGRTPPTADLRRSAVQAAAQTSPSHPPRVRSARGTSPSRSCMPETHPPLPEDRHLSFACRIAARTHP